MRDGKAHLLDGGDAAEGLVHRVVGPGIGQLGHGVQRLAVQGQGRGVDHERPLPVGLEQRPAADRVVLGEFRHGGAGVSAAVGADSLEGGQRKPLRGRFGQVSRAAQLGNGGDGPLFPQRRRDLKRRGLAHAVDQQVRAGIHEHAAAHRVVPVVVVGKAAQAGLEPADDDGAVGEGLPRAVGVDDDGAVRAQSGLLSGGIEVLAAALFRRGVVGHHGVEVARADQDAEAGPAHRGEVLRAVPVRLGQHRDAVALGLQHAADHGGAEGRVVHIGVAGDEQEIIPPPAALLHVLLRDGEEFGCVDVFVHWKLQLGGWPRRFSVTRRGRAPGPQGFCADPLRRSLRSRHLPQRGRQAGLGARWAVIPRAAAPCRHVGMPAHRGWVV